MTRTDYILLGAGITAMWLIGASTFADAWSSRQNALAGCESVHPANKKIQARLFDEYPPDVPIVAKPVEVIYLRHDPGEMLPLLPHQKPSDAYEPTP